MEPWEWILLAAVMTQFLAQWEKVQVGGYHFARFLWGCAVLTYWASVGFVGGLIEDARKRFNKTRIEE